MEARSVAVHIVGLCDGSVAALLQLCSQVKQLPPQDTYIKA